VLEDDKTATARHGSVATHDRTIKDSRMKRIAAIVCFALLLFPLVLHCLSSQTPTPQPLTLPLGCAAKDCPLLEGRPQTAGMRSGFVRLKPSESVGWHTTGKNEEELIILKGRGEVLIEAQPARAFVSPGLVYIPPETRHNVANTAQELLEYVYVVAPAETR
jgi:mannose-6-phosphate isomerase-like protein (cupin superfamily)